MNLIELYKQRQQKRRLSRFLISVQEWREQYELYLGTDGKIHAKAHGHCQPIQVKVPLGFVLANMCGECGSVAEYRKRLEGYTD